MVTWIIAFGLSILAAKLYRMGGTSRGTLWRDLGVPCCMLAWFILTGHWHWILVLCFGLMFGAQTTYNKWAQRLIGIRTNDVMWLGWLVTGLAYSFATLPYIAFNGHWMGFLWRTLIVTGVTVAISELSGKDWVEESGRGWIQIITLPLFV